MSKPEPFTPRELETVVAPLIERIQQACGSTGLLVFDPAEARTLRRLLLYLQTRPAK